MADEIPKILISATIYDSEEEDNLPSIIVTRDSREEDFNYTNLTPPAEAEQLFPQSIYNAAASGDPSDVETVDDFIQNRLAKLGLVPERKEERREEVMSVLEEVLECPVCRDRVVGEVYQCHEGHIMCSSCRVRLLTCPVCRSLLTLPPIRNRALERLARVVL